MSLTDPGANALASNEDFEFAALAEARNYRATLLKTFAPFLKGNVLEIGAGIGQFTAELGQLPAVDRVVAVEPDPRFHEQLLSRISESNIVRGTAADVDQGAPWHGVVSVNVLEHIEKDAAELARYRRLLKATTGCLCLFVPARPEIYAPIDRDFGHYRRYTLPILKKLISDAGFTVLYLHYFNFPGYFLWWLVFSLGQRRGFSKAGVKLYDRLFFPAIAWTEANIAHPPLGQSLIAVARAV